MITENGMDMIARTIVAETLLSEKEFTGKIKELSDLGEQFKKDQKNLMDSLADLEAKKKELEKKLKGNFKDWEQSSNFVTLRSEIQGQISIMGKLGKKIPDVVHGLNLQFRSSKQPSYATGFEIALSLLNQITKDKYINLPTLCKKNVSAIITGIDVLDKDLSEFSPELQDLAKERGIKISSKTFKADLSSFMKEVGTRIKTWFSGSISYFKNLIHPVKDTTKKLEELDSLLNKF